MPTRFHLGGRDSDSWSNLDWVSEQRVSGQTPGGREPGLFEPETDSPGSAGAVRRFTRAHGRAADRFHGVREIVEGAGRRHPPDRA